MAAPVSVLAPGVQAAGVPATAKVTANTRVLAMAGPVGLLTDVMQFPGPPVVGNWVVGASRVLVNGIPVVTAASTGTPSARARAMLRSACSPGNRTGTPSRRGALARHSSARWPISARNAARPANASGSRTWRKTLPPQRFSLALRPRA